MIITFVGNFQVPYSSENHHKKTLESLGHKIVALQEGTASTMEIYNEAIKSKALIWVHTHGWNTPQKRISTSDMLKKLKDGGIPTLTYHLDLWFGLDRQNDLDSDPFYKEIGHFFTVDKLMADWFNDYTNVKGHYLHAGVFDEECNYDSNALKTEQVIFVGSKGYHHEWPYRPELIDWLRNTYGGSFTHVGGDGDTGTLRGKDLNNIYSHTKVAVGDSLCIGFKYPWYWSDRVYETLGRGCFMIHPYIKGMEQDFVAGEHLIFYEFGNFDNLKELIDYYLTHDEEREKIRLAGHEHVKANHTYKNRWQTILDTLGLK